MSEGSTQGHLKVIKGQRLKLRGEFLQNCASAQVNKIYMQTLLTQVDKLPKSFTILCKHDSYACAYKFQFCAQLQMRTSILQQTETLLYPNWH